MKNSKQKKSNNKIEQFVIDYWNTLKFLSIIFTIIVLIIAFNSYFESQISDKLHQKEYIFSLSKSLRPYLIFNEKSNVLYDHSANIHLDSLSVQYEIERELFEGDTLRLVEKFTIKLTPTSNLNFEPILECISAPFYVVSSERYGKRSFVYYLESGFAHELDTKFLFRVEFLE
jgi:hypothetical protein